jgi:predicted HTH domain antitoxin
MATITIKIPDILKTNNFEIGMFLASRWFDDGQLSSGQAAEMVGLSKRAFLELLGKYNTSVFGYDIDEIESDLNHA